MKFIFGSGECFARPSGGNLATPSGPVRLATLQDVSVEFTYKIVELRGQDLDPEDAANADRSIKGKAAFAGFDIGIFSSLMFSDTIAAGMKGFARHEPHTIAGGTDVTTPIQVTKHLHFVEDYGVRYADGSGEFILVAAGHEAKGAYSVDLLTGTYTFDPDDLGKEVLIAYSFSDSTKGKTLTVQSHSQGYGPKVEIVLTDPYDSADEDYPGNVLILPAAKVSKMSLPKKRDGYAISDFEFTAFKDAAGNVLYWSQE